MTVLHVLCLVPSLLHPSGAGGGDWAGWRGPQANGVGAGSPPVEWSEEQNVRWKAPLVGKGDSSPIVWGNQVFVTSALSTGKKRTEPPDTSLRHYPAEEYADIYEQEFLVLSFDRASGKELWRKSVGKAMPHQTTHPDGSYATPTPVTDGEHVFASFGSFGIHALDFQGALAWQVDLGDLRIEEEFGEGTSPILHGDDLVVNWDHEGDCFLIALDKKTGKERWRTPRPKGTSWSTPIVVRVGGRDEIVVGGARTIAYDAASGRELWSSGPADQGGGKLMSSPVPAGELVLVAIAARGGGELRAFVAPDAGEAAPASVDPVWKTSASVPTIPSPLPYQGKLYFLKGASGMLSAIDAESGTVEYGPERLKAVTDVYASPVAAGGRLYVAGRDGTTEVLSPLPKIETLSVNKLEDQFEASPALAGDELFLRGHEHLYCIAATVAK